MFNGKAAGITGVKIDSINAKEDKSKLIVGIEFNGRSIKTLENQMKMINDIQALIDCEKKENAKDAE